MDSPSSPDCSGWAPLFLRTQGHVLLSFHILNNWIIKNNIFQKSIGDELPLKAPDVEVQAHWQGQEKPNGTHISTRTGTETKLVLNPTSIISTWNLPKANKANTLIWLTWTNPRRRFVYPSWHSFWQVKEINQNKFPSVNGCEVCNFLSAGVASD